MARYQTTWWEDTGKRTDFIDGVSSPIYRNCDTNEELSMCDIPVGALYVSSHGVKGPDDLSIVCVIPHDRYSTKKYHWYIDSRASNCTMPTDNEHRCWVRHGTFKGIVHVDKAGHTCQAGAGSIAVDGFHGFLHNGELYDC